MPGGWLADRFSTRPLLSVLIGVWSFFTLLTGLATGYWTLILARIGCGVAEAGAYPSSSKLVPRWIPILSRGSANGIISAGGRLGGAWAPIITAFVITSLGGWRTPGRIFGSIGLIFAVIFWFIFRDRPSEHPLCNRAERDLIEGNVSPEVLESPAVNPARSRVPWGALIFSRDMWAMCAYQALTNVGWVFLVTLMPTFLKEVKGLSEVAVGWMATVALMAGFVGNLAGGWFTDAMVRRYGLRLGRMIPMVTTRIPAALAYLVCLRLNSAWGCVAMFAMVAAMTDLGMPAAWGYAQDVGGRNIAAVFAWPNMFGNIGAGITPKALVLINSRFDPNHNYHASLIFLAIAFLLSSVVAMGIRADVKLEPEQSDARGFDVVMGKQG
jgi:ACS family glucarate transporter-like MFS transporter